MKSLVISILIATAVLAGCAPSPSSVSNSQNARETIETRIRANLQGSTLNQILIEKRSLAWIRENLGMHFDPQAADSSEYWVATLYGTISAALIPGGADAYTPFSRLVILYGAPDGEPLGYMGTP